MKVLSFGSLNIDYTYDVPHMVKKGETLSSRGLQVFTGGKGLNQSIALSKAGAEVYHAGAIGEDGLFLLEAMKEAGVNTEFVEIRSDVRTGNAIIQNDDEGDNCILLYGGANQAITEEHVDRVIEHFEEGDYLVLQNEINNIPYIMERAHAKGLKIVLNPSPMNEKILALPLDIVDIFLVNEIEAGQILGETVDAKKDVDSAIAKLRARFPKATVVMTLGSDGSVYSDAENTYRQKAYKVTAVDTTAAGDTFSGYLISGLLKKMPIPEALDLGARASAVAVSKKGAAPSIPYLEEVKKKKFD